MIKGLGGDKKLGDDDSLLEMKTTSAAQSGSSSSETGGWGVTSSSASTLEYKTVNGSFVYSYGLDVPKFRGLEPNVVLNYSSLRKRKTGGTYQGWLGHGWGLGGFDVIQRASKGKGAPHFLANDIYLLNGSELVLCNTGVVSPSCSAGGTHTTENESYQRIVRDTTVKTWSVTNRLGTVSLFKHVASFMASPPTSGINYQEAENYRWLLARVTNTNGQYVEYDYECLDAPVCMPKTITTVSHDSTTDTPYSVIEFFTESRPDPITFATGMDIARINKRIKTVKISAQ